MKQILTVLKYSLLRHLRNTGDTVLQMIVFPIVLILILGLALSPTFEHREVDPTPVAYFSQDKGILAQHFEQFLASPDVARLVEVHSVQSRRQGLEMLKNREVFALIELDTAEGGAFSLTGHPSFPLRKAIVENVLESFVNGANAVHAMAAMGATAPEFDYVAGAIVDRPISASGLTPGAMDYYGVTMLVMIVMYGSLYASAGMATSYLGPIGRRIKISPIRAAQQYVGLVLANVVTVYGQVLIIIAFTHFAFKVNWGENLPLVLLIAFVLVVLSIGLGTMVVMLTRDETRAIGLLNPLIVFFTFVAGGYFKIDLPGVASYIQYLSPNYLAQTAIFNTIYKGPAQQTMATLAGMLLIIIATFAVAMLAQRRAEQ